MLLIFTTQNDTNNIQILHTDAVLATSILSCSYSVGWEKKQQKQTCQ